MVYMLHCGIKSPRATQRLVCNPGVVCKTLACFYAGAAVNCWENKVNNLRRHAPRVKPGLHKAADVMCIPVRHSFIRRCNYVDL